MKGLPNIANTPERKLAQSLSNVVPSTVIRFSREDYRRLKKLIPLDDSAPVPSDIVDADIVPIHSLSIEIDCRPKNIGIVKVDFHVVHHEPINNEKPSLVAYVHIPHQDDNDVIGLIIYSVDNKLLFTGDSDFPHEINAMVSMFLSTHLPTWYRVQALMLHPTIKEVFRRSGIMSDVDREASGDYKKRPLFYQKVKTINQRELDETVKRCIVRKTLIWYVIGHWRNYKDGRRIFIQPYWKGALRETKMTETPRERVI